VNDSCVLSLLSNFFLAKVRDAVRMSVSVLGRIELIRCGGTGEALNIDLAEFISRLYALILPLSLSPTIETRPEHSGGTSASSEKRSRSIDGDGGNATGISNWHTATEADLLFRALNFAFLASRTPNPPVRTLAFTKRLLSSSLHWPGSSALRAIEFARRLLVKEPKVESMLMTEDRRQDGVYRPEVDDPALANPESTVLYELALLERAHYDPKVRQEASRLANYVRD
jgi:nucleolar complex protein 3